MHWLAQSVADQLGRTPVDDGHGCIRVTHGADLDKVRTFLVEERDAALEEVSRLPDSMPSQLVATQLAAQMLILAELLLADLGQPVYLRAVNTAQGYGTGFYSELIEHAADGLVMLSSGMLETA